jgi:hypothetical protein
VKVLGWGNAEEAQGYIVRSMERAAARAAGSSGGSP